MVNALEIVMVGGVLLVGGIVYFNPELFQFQAPQNVYGSTTQNAIICVDENGVQVTCNESTEEEEDEDKDDDDDNDKDDNDKDDDDKDDDKKTTTSTAKKPAPNPLGDPKAKPTSVNKKFGSLDISKLSKYARRSNNVVVVQRRGKNLRRIVFRPLRNSAEYL